jgi:hypothetical protein
MAKMDTMMPPTTKRKMSGVISVMPLNSVLWHVPL